MARDDSRTSYAYPAPLSEALRSIQDHQHSLSVYVEELLRRIDLVDPHVQAFLAEPKRRERLRGEMTELRRRFPDTAERPPLYGATVGVKDIFHVDGFVTRAGTSLPPQLFEGEEAAVDHGAKRRRSTDNRQDRDDGVCLLRTGPHTQPARY